ncbi:MAG: radical SAM protein [Prevotella sp.]|nr:radical SAM protein [Prevotella sp.]
MLQAPLIGLSRHRIGIDGKGVTTLVAFHGCPLRCAYCLNATCLDPNGAWREVTTDGLLQEVKIDDLYFQATGGGICFGGGEPCLRADFICEFASLMPQEWKITIETSLNVDQRLVEKLFPLVDQWIVDVKDMNPDIYKRYTERDNKRTVDNLRWLIAHDDMADRMLLRLPLIADYNTHDDVARSRQKLEEMGFTRFDEFKYMKKPRTPIT